MRPDRSVSHATARPTTSTAYPARVSMKPNSSTAAPHTSTAGTSPIGMRADVGRCCEGGGGHVPSLASADAGGKSRSCARPDADADAARGRPPVGRTCHDRCMTRMPRPCTHPSPHAAIVPPYLLARIARLDDPRFDAAADAARRSLQRDAPLREWRAAGELPSFMAPERPVRDERPAAAPGTAPQPDRRISDAEGADRLPGRLVRREGQPPSGDARRRPGLRRARRHVRDVRTRVRPRLDRRRRHAARGHRALRRSLRQRLLGRRAHGVRRRRRRGVPRVHAVDQRDRARARARRHRAHGPAALPGPVRRAQRARLRRVRRARRAVLHGRRTPSRRPGSSARACSPTRSRGAPSAR